MIETIISELLEKGIYSYSVSGNPRLLNAINQDGELYGIYESTGNVLAHTDPDRPFIYGKNGENGISAFLAHFGIDYAGKKSPLEEWIDVAGCKN